MKKFNLPLVNVHTHSAMVAFRWLAEDLALEKWLQEYIWPMEGKYVNSDFVYENTKKAILEMYKNWIKLAADMYFYPESWARAAEELWFHYIIWNPIINFPVPWVVDWLVWIRQTEDLIKKYKDSEFIRVSVTPHSIYVTSEDLLIQSKELAQKYNVTFHTHLSESNKEFDDCVKLHWCTPVKYLYNLWILNEKCILAHCVWLTDEDIEILSQTKSNVVHCPLSNLKLGSWIAPISKLLEKWVNVCLWTDWAASSNRLDIWEAGKFAWLLQKWITNNPEVLPAREVIKMMTINWMKALGFESLDWKTIDEIERIIDKEDNFNYLYELNIWEI